MHFSKATGRFVVDAMIDVALREDLGPASLTDIAQRQHISLSYLEQLFSKLRLHGLVTSIRGPGGGYILGRPIEDITVADIICAVDDVPSREVQPVASPTTDLTQDLWDAMNAKVLNFTRSVTLKSLVLNELAKGVKVERRPPPSRGVFKMPKQQSVRSDVPNSVFALGGTSRTGS